MPQSDLSKIEQGFQLISTYVGDIEFFYDREDARKGYKTALHLFRMGILSGENINAQDQDGRTCLMHAMMFEDYALVDFCIHNKADLFVKDKGGSDVFDNAIFDADGNFLKHIIRHHSQYLGVDFVNELQEFIDEYDGNNKVLAFGLD